MCTVTVLPQTDGFVLTMNRDECRTRQELGLRTTTISDVELCYPVDSEAGGTWVGINNQGVAMALLNRYQAPTIDGATSRGEIIINALSQGSAPQVAAFMQQLEAARYNPFDCLLVSSSSVEQFGWDQTDYTHSELSDSALMLTSSSERLDEVRHYRQQAFKQWQQEWSKAKEIDRFHLRQDEGMARSATLMAREPTHTKSLVQIQVSSQRATLSYYDEYALQANARLAQLNPSSTHSLPLREPQGNL